MTVYCSGDCHVWLGSSSLCTCEALRQALQLRSGCTQDATHRVAMLFPNYNPYGPHSKPESSTPPLAQFHAAQQAGASHLSADGQWIYCERFGAILEAEWQGDAYGSWWACEGLPGDAVVLK